MIDDKGSLTVGGPACVRTTASRSGFGESLWACTIGGSRRCGDAPHEFAWDVYYDASSADLLRREYASFYGLSELDPGRGGGAPPHPSMHSASNLGAPALPGMTGNVMAPLKLPGGAASPRRRATWTPGERRSGRASAP